MNEDFCSYEIAQALKEAGFDCPCRHYYTKEDASDGNVWLTSAAFSPEDWNDGRNSEPDFLKPLCSAPSLWEAQKWLREKKLWHIEVRINGCRNMFCVELWEMKANGGAFRLQHKGGRVILYDTYESALSAGIEAALKLIEEGEV